MHKQIQYTTRGGAINVLSPNIKKCMFYNEENFVGGVVFLMIHKLQLSDLESNASTRITLEVFRKKKKEIDCCG